MDQDGAKRIERRSANRGKLAECISEIRYRILDTEITRSDTSLRHTPWAGTRTSGGQYRTPSRIRLAQPHREGRHPRQSDTHSVWGPSRKPIAKDGEARPGEQQDSHRPTGRYHPVDSLWGFREGGGCSGRCEKVSPGCRRQVSSGRSRVEHVGGE
jgi:hypothetical protein